jgi:hypothetical protein
MRKLITIILVAVAFVSTAQTHDYAHAQHLATYFFGAQRSGDNQSWIHGPSHTQDGQSLNPSADLTGGWHDCGDYLKFNFTSHWAAAMMLFSYHLYPEAFADDYSQAYSAGSPNGIPDVLDEVKIQTDYIIRSYNGGNAVLQVGHGTYDHNGSFSEPVTMSAQPVNKGGDPRPVYIDNDCPNVLGAAASALALMSMAYESFDATYAAECEAVAIQYYNLAQGKTGSCGSRDCFNGGSPCYDLSAKSHTDEMAMAAATLYEATGLSSYLTAAENYFDMNIWNGEVHYYGNMYMPAAAQLYLVSGNNAYLNKLQSHFDYHSQTQFSTLGFYKYQWSGGWANLQYTSYEAHVAAMLHLVDPNTNTDAYNFLKSNVDFILGSHNGVGNVPANFSFLIGYDEMGGGYPLRPHHKAAFGSTRLDWSLFTQESNSPGSVTYAYELKGALVGGPGDNGNYADEIDVFENSEVCTYYNAGFLGAVAYVNKVENGLLTSSEDIAVEEALKVFPTITDQNVTIVNRGNPMTISLFDAGGKLIQTKLVQATEVFNLDQLSDGVYFLRSDNGSWSQKIIKK